MNKNNIIISKTYINMFASIFVDKQNNIPQMTFKFVDENIRAFKVFFYLCVELFA